MHRVTFPMHKFTILTDAAARPVIERLGLLPQLPDAGSFAKTVQYCRVHRHPTHWLLLARFCGFADIEANGYLVGAWPKDLFPAQVLDEAIQEATPINTRVTTRDLPLIDPNHD